MMMTKIPRGQTQERRDYMKMYVATHPKRDRRAYKKSYDLSHKEQNKLYRILNEKKLTLKKAAYYKDNRDRLLEYQKNRAHLKKEAISIYQAKHYLLNSDRIKANVAEYQMANPEKKRHLENRRRAHKFKNGGQHSAGQWIELKLRYKSMCLCCKRQEPQIALTRDHIIPLSMGGTDNIENIQPLCRSCNSRKNNRIIDFIDR